MGGNSKAPQRPDDGDAAKLWDLLEDAFLRYPEGRQQIRGFAAIPDSVLPVMPDYWWDEHRLRQAALGLPVEDTWTYELEWALEVRLWPSPSGPFTVTPREVMETPRLYQDQWRMALGVDLHYPIVLAQKGSRWVLLDGYRRLLKATVQRTPSIGVVRLPPGRLSTALIQDGFYGELNRLRRLAPDLLVPARAVARTLLQRPGSEWTEAAAERS